MTRPRLARKPRHVQSVIRAQDEAFLLSLDSQISSALRALIATVRTWGHLPAPVVRRLKEDAVALGMGPLEYLQLALHQRYRTLVSTPAAPKQRQGPRGRSDYAVLTGR